MSEKEQFEQDVKRLVELYEKKLALANRMIEDLKLQLQQERQNKIALEVQVQQLAEEVKGLLTGSMNVNKQAAQLILFMAEKYGTIMNAAKALSKPKIPYRLIITGVVVSVAIASITYLLSQPVFLTQVFSWLSVWTNQVFVAVVVVLVAIAGFIILRRRRRSEMT